MFYCKDNFFLLCKYLNIKDVISLLNTSKIIHSFNNDMFLWNILLNRDFNVVKSLPVMTFNQSYKKHYLINKLIKKHKLDNTLDELYSISCAICNKNDIMLNTPSEYHNDNIKLQLEEIIKHSNICIKANDLIKKCNNELLREHDVIISIIPIELFQLDNLCYIHFRDSYIHIIPKQIGNLERLTVLSLDNNIIRRIPKELYNLVNLIHLGLDNNKIITISNNISKLTNLTYLSLNDNKIWYIPNEIAYLTNLNTLYLHHNKINKLSNSFTKLKSLNAFTLDRKLHDKTFNILSTMNIRNICYNETEYDMLKMMLDGDY